MRGMSDAPGSPEGIVSLLAAFSEGVDADCVQAPLAAWLIGTLSEEEALLAARLQRDGWLVRQFADIDDALSFWRSAQGGLEPAGPVGRARCVVAAVPCHSRKARGPADRPCRRRTQGHRSQEDPVQSR